MTKLPGPILRSDAILLEAGGSFMRFGSVTSQISYMTSLSTSPLPFRGALQRIVASVAFISSLTTVAASDSSVTSSGTAGFAATSESLMYIFGDVIEMPG